MTQDFDHNRAIRDAAREILRPLGCIQKGRSRLWYVDHAWWLALVEFQPSGFSRGSYLNVGACFLWHESSTFPFGDFAGERPWLSEHELTGDGARDLAMQARDSLFQVQERHSDVVKTASYLNLRDSHSNWGHFDAGVALGLSGRTSEAQAHFRSAIADANGIEWIEQLNVECLYLFNLVGDELKFLEWAEKRVSHTRQLKGLPPIQISRSTFLGINKLSG